MRPANPLTYRPVEKAMHYYMKSVSGQAPKMHKSVSKRDTV
jgi:hypothetical protein